MNGKLIVFTGLDGSGTSSIAEELHKSDFKSSLFNSVGCPYTNIKSEIDQNVEQFSVSAHYLFYLSAVVFSSALIEEKLKNGNVYCVRHLIDTVVSHRVAGLDVDLIYENNFYKIRKPDLIIFLNVNEDLRQDRLNNRGKGYLDKKLDNDEFRLKFLIEFQRFSDCFIEINIQSKTISQIAEEIKPLIFCKS